GLTGDAAASSNLTGLTTFVPELSARRIELLRQIMPGVTRVAALWNPASGSAAVDLKTTRAAAQAQNVEILSFEVKGDSDVREIFVKIKEQRVQALIVLADALMLARRETIATAASRNGLPSVSALRDFVDAGGLISYGATWTDVFRQAAGLVDRILRGARPSNLPMARTSRLELIGTRPTPRAIPLPIPLPLLRLGVRVIQCAGGGRCYSGRPADSWPAAVPSSGSTRNPGCHRASLTTTWPSARRKRPTRARWCHRAPSASTGRFSTAACSAR